jgi:hypothetical protein
MSSPRIVRFEVFRGTFATWQELFEQAAEFATQVGRERLISISHSEDKDDGVVSVWYWSNTAADDVDEEWTEQGLPRR